jgi:hypothetical protein
MNDWAAHPEKPKHPEEDHGRDQHGDPEKSLLTRREILHHCLRVSPDRGSVR